MKPTARTVQRRRFRSRRQAGARNHPSHARDRRRIPPRRADRRGSSTPALDRNIRRANAPAPAIRVAAVRLALKTKPSSFRTPAPGARNSDRRRQAGVSAVDTGDGWWPSPLVAASRAGTNTRHRDARTRRTRHAASPVDRHRRQRQSPAAPREPGGAPDSDRRRVRLARGRRYGRWLVAIAARGGPIPAALARARGL